MAVSSKAEERRKRQQETLRKRQAAEGKEPVAPKRGRASTLQEQVKPQEVVKITNVDAARSDVLAKLKSAGFALPADRVVVPGGPVFQLTCGLHVIAAPATGGKTLTALGLAAWLLDLGVPVQYHYVYEPGASLGVTQLNETQHGQWIDSLPRTARETTTIGNLEIQRGEPLPQVVVVDSLTLALRMLGDAKALTEKLGDQAYPGGLKPADLAGAAAHNRKAEVANICMIATVNSEMLPIVKMLTGAIMGAFTISSPGVFVGQERSDRVIKPVKIPYKYMNEASLSLGYGVFNSAQELNGRV